MFLEPHFKGQRSGWVEVICGSMFSGKTEELIRRLKRAQYAYQKVMVFKPAKDTRYDDQNVVSHDSNMIRSTPVRLAKDILIQSDDFDVIGIDEAQFFDGGLPEVCNEIANRGIRVIVAGLDMDFTGQPFGPVPALMAIAELVTKVNAVCVRCGCPAMYSYRKVASDAKILLGEKESYEPRCRFCFHVKD